MDFKQLREQKLLTQQQLADLIGVDRTLISKIESGVSAPSVATAKKIAAALNFDWTLFFQDDDDEQDEQAASKKAVGKKAI